MSNTEDTSIPKLKNLVTTIFPGFDFFFCSDDH